MRLSRLSQPASWLPLARRRASPDAPRSAVYRLPPKSCGCSGPLSSSLQRLRGAGQFRCASRQMSRLLRHWRRFGNWRRFGAAQRSEGYPPSMTLRRSVPALGLAGVRVSGWPRGSAPGVPAASFRARTRRSRPTRLWRLWRYQSSPLLECVQRAGRINARRSPDELDHLLKLGSAELGHNLVDASLMQQQDSRDNGFGHALGGSPAHIDLDEEELRNDSS